ncbi:hypothetical protein Tco_0558932 [Tanacetum coccineum]
MPQPVTTQVKEGIHVIVLEDGNGDAMEVITKQEIVVEALKLQLVVEEETYENLCVEVKDTMVVNLTTRLPKLQVIEFIPAKSILQRPEPSANSLKSIQAEAFSSGSTKLKPSD